jgi:hypothetical protein
MQVDAAEVGPGYEGDGGRKLRLLTLKDLDGRTRARQRAEELRERVISERGGADRLDVIRVAHTDTWAAYGDDRGSDGSLCSRRAYRAIQHRDVGQHPPV